MLSDNLKKLRIANKKTQKQVAEYLNITREAYTQYENGKREPDIETLKKLADYFNVSIDLLLDNNKNDLMENLTPEVLILIKKISSLSEESKKDLEEYIKLLKIRDDTESTRDESSLTLEEHA